MYSPSRFSSVALLSLGFISTASAAITSISALSTEWTRVNYINNGLADPSADSNGQNAEELVGNADLAVFFIDYNDQGTVGTSDDIISFRTRHAETKNGGADFTSNLFIGIDVDSDFKLDGFVGVNTSGNSETIFIANPDNSALNTSVNTSKLDTTYVDEQTFTATNFSWRAVTEDDTDGIGESLDIDGANTDYYLSFQMNFDTLATALQANSQAGDVVTKNSIFRFVIGTSTQNNSFNKDIGGLDGNDLFGTPFDELPGGTTTPVDATGVPILVPEPSSSVLILGALLGFLGIRRRRS